MQKFKPPATNKKSIKKKGFPLCGVSVAVGQSLVA